MLESFDYQVHPEELELEYLAMEEYYGFCPSDLSVEEISAFIRRWRESVVALDRLLYEDAVKELTLSGITAFDSDPFIISVKEHIEVKSALADQVLQRLASI